MLLEGHVSIKQLRGMPSVMPLMNNGGEIQILTAWPKTLKLCDMLLLMQENKIYSLKNPMIKVH